MTKEKYIVRSAHAGVFYGDIVSREKDEVTMANALDWLKQPVKEE